MTKELERYKQYSRKDVHDIFSSNTNFTPRAGIWGMWGIVKVPNTIKDYVFFVTYGSKQSGHNFEENIDEHGILTWQTQPSMVLDSPAVKDFISHNKLTDNIYLFLRDAKLSDQKIAKDFIYLGKLAYISHDENSEKPVNFKWQIIDFDMTKTRESLKNVSN